MDEAQQRSEIEKIIAAFFKSGGERAVAVAVASPIAFSFDIAGDALQPAASVIKLPLVMTIYEAAAQGRLDLSQRTPVAAFSQTRYVSILQGLDKDTTLSLREACRLALMTSDNPLAVYLQSLTSFDAVNDLIERVCGAGGGQMGAGFSEEELGPKNLANEITPHACLALLAELRANPAYSDLAHAMRNNLRGNRIPALLPETALVAHKTGTLAGVVNDIGAVEDGSIKFDIAFLCSGEADEAAATREIAECARDIFNALLR